jgi:hypothetical protein
VLVEGLLRGIDLPQPVQCRGMDRWPEQRRVGRGGGLAPVPCQFVATSREVRHCQQVLPLCAERVARAQAQRALEHRDRLVEVAVEHQRRTAGAERCRQPVALGPRRRVAQQRRKVPLRIDVGSVDVSKVRRPTCPRED